jgi:hypothetical protein
VRVEPLAPSRHRLELTVSTEVRAKLERARDLMSHRIARNDLETVLDQALDALLAKLEKERVGDGVPRAIRREVFERDGEQCTFTDERGNRCRARSDLELDHIVPRARGGADEVVNLRVVCRPHNQLHQRPTTTAMVAAPPSCACLVLTLDSCPLPSCGIHNGVFQLACRND